MKYFESEKVELKKKVVDDIKKEVIALANCKGGKIYIGVDDNGDIVGVSDVDEDMLKITNMIRDSIKPDITMFIDYEIIKENKKNIILINVQNGTRRPYYLVKKGLRPEGVYVRQGTSTVSATDAAIRQMIKETDGDSFELMRSLKQELDFDVVKKEFAARKFTFTKKQQQTLEVMTIEGVYTNLGLLLSDQCVHTIKVAVFEGVDQNNFKDRQEFEGSILKQLNDVYEYIDFRNSTYATFERLTRTDVRDYPEVAIRETLLNMIVHRDYSFKASANISIYADRIEFVSLGGLCAGLELEDALTGVSVCRNEKLANIFYRLKLIEAYGTGLQKIMSAYKLYGVKPKIEVTHNTFKVILPNVNYKNDSYIYDISSANILRDNISLYASGMVGIGISKEALIIDYVSKNGVITRKKVEELCGVSETTAYRILDRMVKSGMIRCEKSGKNTKYFK